MNEDLFLFQKTRRHHGVSCLSSAYCFCTLLFDFVFLIFFVFLNFFYFSVDERREVFLWWFCVAF
jgi:hypothetical protein